MPSKSAKAIKHDGGKAPLGLLPPPAMVEIAKVLGFGASKYGAWNWAKGMDWSRMYDALQRHLVAFWSGEDEDQESGLPHLAHAGCCLMFLLSYHVQNVGVDDRYTGPSEDMEGG